MEKLRRFAETPADANPYAARPAPGRTTATARLQPPPRTVILRVESAEAARTPSAGAEEAVAAAGASTSQPLPDPVRARFEASLDADLSRVRVHTGDASAHAARAVGARAFAAGDDIHFGAGQYAPADPFGLHLLAHEVVHTVQQRGGAPAGQRKLEIGSSADPLEAEADRAADAMVAGRPAAVIGGGGRLQRKPKPDHDEAGARTRLVRAALLAAQSLLDRATVDHVVDPVALAAIAGLTDVHLAEAVDTLSSEPPLDTAGLHGPMEQVSIAVRGFRSAAFGASPAQHESSDMQRLIHHEHLLRRLIGLPEIVAKGPHHVVRPGMVSANQRAGIEPALVVARLAAERAFAQLVAGGARDEIVARAAIEITDRLSYAREILELDRPHSIVAARPHLAELQRTTESVLVLRRWMVGRPDNAGLIASFHDALAATDSLRALVELPPLSALPEPRMPEGAVERAAQENRDQADAASKLDHAIDQAFSGFKDGTAMFEHLVALKDIEQPDFWEALAIEVLSTAAATIAAEIGAALVGAVGAGMTPRRASETAVEHAADIVKSAADDLTDSMTSKGLEGDLTSARAKAASDDNEKTRARTFWVAALDDMHAAEVRMFKDAIADRVAKGTVSTEELHSLRDRILAQIGPVHGKIAQAVYRSTAAKWALYTAQVGLDPGREGRPKHGKPKTSRMGEYFGREVAVGHVIGGKMGTDGVMKLSVRVGRTEEGPGWLEIAGAEVFGMNELMRDAVLENARHEVAHLGLPLEIHVTGDVTADELAPTGADEPPSPRHAVLAVDETGRLRGTRDWDSLQPPPSWRAKHEALFYARPEGFLAALWRTKIPQRGRP